MTFSPWTFLLEAINFVVLAYILHRLLYRPLHEAIERRRSAVKKARTDAENARAESEAIRKQLEAELAEVEQQREETMNEARREAESERKKILDEAHTKAELLQAEIRRSLEHERTEIMEKLSGEVVNHAVNLAGRLLQQSADTTLQSQLEKRLIETLSSISADEREQLRRDLRTEDTAYLEASAKPDDEAVRRFNNILNEVAGKMIALRAEIQPALIGGFRLRIGGHLWDASIAGQLEGAQVRRREVHGNV